MFETFSIDSLAFFESIIQPAFADIVPAGFPFQGTLNEFSIMDNVVSKRPIIDIRRVQNILQRRDASCDINYKKVVGATTRQISVEEVYGATQFCRNEFYTGCLKDFRANDPLFGNKILPFFQGAVNVDIASNAYFGDVDRVVGVNAQWSTNIFDGIFKWIKKYITAGVIPAGQTISIADGTDYTANATAAYTLIKGLYDKQPVLMSAFADSQKAIYVSKDIAAGYEDYLISTGTTAQGYTLLTNGIEQLSYKGIPILVEQIWKPIISELKGSLGHAAILTLRGNFVFATDKNYGEGEDGKTALEVWYEKKDMQWYYRLFLKAGTQMALPEFVVIALSSWS
ncbi:hypothetical protein [Chitinophaga sancti]|uniref:Phage major capsid protein, HK97 family n=1 Tax=Chitinophaga sancti TaxID=1004 RepID=A0A1K1M1T8_9BACT|nr:hypothetical protein [Chitinophaga sancti]WQD64751.1 hypothetical protein U0033_10120 [Chitinophaga sancti]WQG89627.1 hypothetical protein SR876_32355 [Chitinophaga sancti]SFW15902.1 hypothetical protein SAMN05661012_00320 [Chitinophaga sancti]